MWNLYGIILCGIYLVLFYVESIWYYFMWNLYGFFLRSDGYHMHFPLRDFIQQEVLKFSENRKFFSENRKSMMSCFHHSRVQLHFPARDGMFVI